MVLPQYIPQTDTSPEAIWRLMLGPRLVPLTDAARNSKTSGVVLDISNLRTPGRGVSHAKGAAVTSPGATSTWHT
jgi:hypothetical protein